MVAARGSERDHLLTHVDGCAHSPPSDKTIGAQVYEVNPVEIYEWMGARRLYLSSEQGSEIETWVQDPAL